MTKKVFISLSLFVLIFVGSDFSNFNLNGKDYSCSVTKEDATDRYGRVACKICYR